MEKLYLLQNLHSGYLGNCPCFWMKGGGYGQWIDEAEKFTLAQVKDIIKSTSSSHKWKIWPWDIIDKAAQRTVDSQVLPVLHDIELLDAK